MHWLPLCRAYEGAETDRRTGSGTCRRSFHHFDDECRRMAWCSCRRCDRSRRRPCHLRRPCRPGISVVTQPDEPAAAIFAASDRQAAFKAEVSVRLFATVVSAVFPLYGGHVCHAAPFAGDRPCIRGGKLCAVSAAFHAPLDRARRAGILLAFNGALSSMRCQTVRLGGHALPFGPLAMVAGRYPDGGS
ncbi:hypothetical protein D3C87_1434750 [compost metagenome]